MQPQRAVPTPATVAALVSGVALCLGAAPTVTDRDAGELSTAAYRLNVAHPTGFPLDLCLLRLASLVPVGNVAFRMNLCVAALGAVTCALLASVCARMAPASSPSARYAAGLLPTVALLASATVVRAWTAVEVYAAALGVAAGALALLAADASPRASRRRVVAALGGVALFAMHTSARPAVALALLALVWERGDTVRTLARRAVPLLALAALTMPLVLWLVVASRRDGPMDWGDPETPRALAAHLSAASIRVAYATRMLVAWRLPEDGVRGARMLWGDLGPVVLALAAVGVATRLRERVVAVAVVVAAVDFVYAVAVNPMGIVDRQTFFHAEGALALLAGAGLASVAQRAQTTRWRVVPAALALLAALVAFARRDASWVGVADGWMAPEALGGAGALGAVPSRALVLCGSDDLCGVSFYTQWVEGDRPDVTVLPRQQLATAWTWRRIRASRIGEPVAPVGRDGEGDAAVARTLLLLERFGDRVRWEGTGESEPPAVRARWRFGSGETPVLARVAAPVTDVDLDAVAWVRARLPSAMGAGARWIGGMVLFAAGARAARDDLSRAEPLWRAAIAVNPDHVSARTNLGVALARQGRLGDAIAMTRAALALDPERPTAWRNLRDYLRATGDEVGAAEAAREATRRR